MWGKWWGRSYWSERWWPGGSSVTPPVLEGWIKRGDDDGALWFKRADADGTLWLVRPVGDDGSWLRRGDGGDVEIVCRGTFHVLQFGGVIRWDIDPRFLAGGKTEWSGRAVGDGTQWGKRDSAGSDTWLTREIGQTAWNVRDGDARIGSRRGWEPAWSFGIIGFFPRFNLVGVFDWSVHEKVDTMWVVRSAGSGTWAKRNRNSTTWGKR